MAKRETFSTEVPLRASTPSTTRRRTPSAPIPPLPPRNEQQMVPLPELSLALFLLLLLRLTCLRRLMLLLL